MERELTNKQQQNELTDEQLGEVSGGRIGYGWKGNLAVALSYVAGAYDAVRGGGTSSGNGSSGSWAP